MFGKLPDDLLQYGHNFPFHLLPTAGEIFVPVQRFPRVESPAPPLPGADLAV
jgi:hypothetical protein